jgi:hypothetical protein
MDIVEAGAEGGKISFTPKSIVDKQLAEGLDDARLGRTHGPYDSAETAIAALDARSNRRIKNRK